MREIRECTNPSFLKENFILVDMSLKLLAKESIHQYEKEERSLLAKRAVREKKRLNQLLACMRDDVLSTPEKTSELKKGLFKLTGDVKFKRSKNMGELLTNTLDFVTRNYKNENPFILS
jgi:hypothetical protein